MKRIKTKKQNVYVAMSGGVDSSVAATLLKERGFNVVGVFMKPWSRFTSSESSTSKSRILDPALAGSGQPFCMWKQDREDALRAASKIGIPLLTWDFSREYKTSVTDYMIREYKLGRTPNPDVMCNKEIKFSLFLEKALGEGADFIATGHYIKKIKMENRKLKINEYKLLKAKDKNKDQSYFLWTLGQKELKYSLFPIGDYIKPEVRRLAKQFGLDNHDKKDSQGVCFVGELNMGKFLKEYIKPKKGKILMIDKESSSHGLGRSNYRVIGSHDGIYYYTIGQRHGLDIKDGGGPYYITGKDIKRNILYIGNKELKENPKIMLKKIKFTNKNHKFPMRIKVRLRYRAPLRDAILNKKGELKLLQKEKSIAPGQSVVFYKGKEMLGGGIIR